MLSREMPAIIVSPRISNAGIAAARRKFTPEFINRLDNIVVRIQGSRTPEELLLEREHQTLVEQELSRVPPLYCDALRLAFCEDQSMKEIAGHLGISVPAAKMRLRRGRAHLRREVLARLPLKDGLTPESRARLESCRRGTDWTAAA